MKRSILILICSLSFGAKANIWDQLDLPQFIEGFLLMGESVAEGLEKARQWQHQKMDVEHQWNSVCTLTLKVNKSVQKFDDLLRAHHLDQKVCLPITDVLKLQTQVVSKCQDFYSESVTSNSEFIINEFSNMMFASGALLTQCYPSLDEWIPHFDQD